MHPKDFREDARRLVEQMTLSEKASLLSGTTFWDLQPIERLGMETIMVSDGPHGLRTQDTSSGDHLGLTASALATCFPTAVTLASSWDDALVYKVGQAIAEEALALGVSVILGPGINIKRSPLCGRNFEYFSEDPYLSGRLGVAFINGAQSKDVGTCVKHFAANNQETNRMAVDTLVDERTLRELYFPAFEMAIKGAQPWTVMHAYNRLNGVYCGESSWLLNDVLRGEWGFEGLVMSDWGATTDRVACARSGLDLEMPTSGDLNDGKVRAAVEAGVLAEREVDTLAQRVVSLTMAGRTAMRAQEADLGANHELAERAAIEGAVLLKNADDVLPLAKTSHLAVIGGFAEKPRFQGAGSSQVKAARLDAPLDALRAAVESAGGKLTYAKGFDADYAAPDQALIDEAAAAATDADAVVILAGLPGLFESEGFDRTTLDMPEQINALIQAVSKTNPKTVVALSNGSPVLMPWLNDVSGVLELYLAGQAGAGALAKLLFGDANPSGKLAETFPVSLDSVPAHVDYGQPTRRVVYREGLNVGYRFYTSYDKPVLFPFGFGLSYTQFSLGTATLEGGDPSLSRPVDVMVPVTNTGGVAGAAVIQVYVRQKNASAFRPDRELKGYQKLNLAPGETKEARIKLDRRSFAFWDVEARDWRVEKDEFEILVGTSSVDISAFLPFETAGDAALKPRPVFEHAQPETMSDKDLAALGLMVTPAEGTRPFHRNSMMGDIRNHWFGKRIYTKAEEQMQAFFTNENDDPVVEKMGQEFLKAMPLRALQMLSGGALKDNQLDLMLAVMNGHPVKVLRSLLNR